MSIKVCGMRDLKNVQLLTGLEVRYIGFIFYPKSPRYAEDPPGRTDTCQLKRVGVFVDAEIRDIVRKKAIHDLDIIQVHGQENPKYCYELKQRTHAGVWKAFRIDDRFDFNQLDAFEDVVDAFLFDAKGVQPGGNGIRFDWSLLDNYRGATPFLLSGGIDPGAVASIRALDHPRLIGIDLNSRFEIEPGVKDIPQLQNFIDELYR
ncbi:MAG: phosphoribosylanthranilate isomerase [Saprospiraceae bacterium]|nr:phosphoribosylanthranilate isomerase [Saprospiraceae bacterium]